MVSPASYDLIIAGAGLAGSALGTVMAQAGARVLILERQRRFSDRVRGEMMFPWGVAAARSLGLNDAMLAGGAREVRYWDTHFAADQPPRRRDFVETTPHRTGTLNFHHPQMQEVLLRLAESSGAVVERGVKVTGVTPGPRPSVTVAQEDGEATVVRKLRARLVVGAEGRGSRLRALAGFEVRRDPKGFMMAGALLSLDGLPDDHNMMFSRPSKGLAAYLAPLGGGQYRAYCAYSAQDKSRKMSGASHIGDFLQACVDAGVPAAWYENARLEGPLAVFDASDEWVEHPYRLGVTLIGDAAATSDPIFGCGLSLAMRDVQALRDALLAEPDWAIAADRYAAAHDRAFNALHRLLGWIRPVIMEPGAHADALRERVLPHWAANPEMRPDTQGLGPDAPSDEAAWRRAFDFESHDNTRLARKN